MAQWVIETKSPYSNEWNEIGSVSTKQEAIKIARAQRKSFWSPKQRVRTRIDHSRGGMTG